MIISASRRTDIPAFYSDCFFNRWRDGRVFVRNPMNAHQVSDVKLSPDVIDCVVFWTKNPAQMLSRHSQDMMKLPVPFYFQFTVTPYGKDIETNVLEKKHIFETFIALSKMLGKERVIWRYDPIVFTDKMDCDFHIKSFGTIAKKLAPYTEKCIFSFLDFYSKTERNMHSINCFDPTFEQKSELCRKIVDYAAFYGLTLETCAETLNLDYLGIQHGKCVDPKLIAHLCGGRLIAGKDKNQRKNCGCINSIDIGAYNTCRHGCLYCYANYDHATADRLSRLHAPGSPLLYGQLTPEDVVTERKMDSLVDRQQTIKTMDFWQ